ncbi:hypothetical protein CAOG_04084 [Capsaspora owczarzaki ATCC 30864]|uniref:LIM zinc-binding domain-containing protein n=1 Tax=Capsaspora owczarzaki (strain ATCC 30864) TaxID=595528 RepID=A0A0D2VR13_CAPO3|nr:hypothetical protein CAOG_04084 [Capsaspora owczarzaki ATCC 30864]KJE93272.1 hypothetical protein CAOG_004084 [Capsaspora owczarzaki ATCC 30864]|eukprot:XP_004347909.2 hypothetical protein CAOG_04084 [Capsaspora owczarzaki ATCC 30864]
MITADSTLTCPVCSKPAGDITDKTVGAQHWHLYCFNCAMCGSYLDGKFFRDESTAHGLLCPTCHTHPIKLTTTPGSVSYVAKIPTIAPVNSDTCPRCSKTVYQAEKIRALDANWHKRCLSCEGCHKALAAGSFQARDNKPYCKTCFGTAYKV